MVSLLCLPIILSISLCSCRSNSNKQGDQSSLFNSSSTTTLNSTSTTTTDDSASSSSSNNFNISSSEPITSSSNSSSKSTITTPPDTLMLSNYDWSKVDAFRIKHTQGPPFKAVTLTKGTVEYQELLTIFKKVEGTYYGISEGIYGGYSPIFLYQNNTQIDRIQMSYNLEMPCFSTDLQKSVSKTNGNFYPDLYKIDTAIFSELNAFLEKLDYSENF